MLRGKPKSNMRSLLISDARKRKPHRKEKKIAPELEVTRRKKNSERSLREKKGSLRKEKGKGEKPRKTEKGERGDSNRIVRAASPQENAHPFKSGKPKVSSIRAMSRESRTSATQSNSEQREDRKIRGGPGALSTTSRRTQKLGIAKP